MPGLATKEIRELQAHKGLKEFKAFKAPQVLRDHKDQRVRMVVMVRPEPLVQPDHKVHKVPLVQQALLELQALQVLMVAMALQPLLLLERSRRVPLVRAQLSLIAAQVLPPLLIFLYLVARQALLAQPAPLGLKALQVLMALMELMVQMVLLVLLVQPELLVRLGLRGQREPTVKAFQLAVQLVKS